MKKLQCRECELVFWTELDLIGNQVIGSDEWVHVECPKCGEEWAIYEPGKKETAGAIAAAAKRPKARRKAVPARRKKPSLKKSLQREKETPFVPGR